MIKTKLHRLEWGRWHKGLQHTGNVWNQLVLFMALHGSLCNMDVIKNKKGIQTLHLSVFHDGI